MQATNKGNGRARKNHNSAILSIPGENRRAHTMEFASLASRFTIVHNRPPIDSPILRLTFRDLARDAKQRETLQI